MFACIGFVLRTNGRPVLTNFFTGELSFRYFVVATNLVVDVVVLQVLFSCQLMCGG